MKNHSRLPMRLFLYVIGMIILSFGIVLNTKTMLGVSAIVSVPYNIAAILSMNLGTVVFFYYIFCIFLQWVILRKRFQLFQLFQIVVSMICSVCIDYFDSLIPSASESYVSRFLVLAAAILITGIGAAMVVDMKLVPNPADGLASAIGIDLLHKDFGLGKNVLDISCVLVSTVLSLVFLGRINGIGIGTLFAALFIGRCISLFNHLCKKPLEKLAGIYENK